MRERRRAFHSIHLRPGRLSYQFPMISGGFADDLLLARPLGTLSSIPNGGEGWGEEVPEGFYRL